MSSYLSLFSYLTPVRLININIEVVVILFYHVYKYNLTPLHFIFGRIAFGLMPTVQRSCTVENIVWINQITTLFETRHPSMIQRDA
jgi:hypothetical protein